MNKGAAEYKKIVIVCAVLLLLLGGTIMVRSMKQRQLQQEIGNNSVRQISPFPTYHPVRATYKIVLNGPTVPVGETIDAKLLFEAKGFIITGSDVYLKYDPVFLEVQTIATGDFFLTYPRKTTDEKKGMVKLTGFQSNVTTPINQAVLFATVTFVAKQQGETSLSYDFVPDATDRTTIVEKGTAQNVLDAVDGAKVTIN